jgi:hypothetical protein
MTQNGIWRLAGLVAVSAALIVLGHGTAAARSSWVGPWLGPVSSLNDAALCRVEKAGASGEQGAVPMAVQAQQEWACHRWPRGAANAAWSEHGRYMRPQALIGNYVEPPLEWNAWMPW